MTDFSFINAFSGGVMIGFAVILMWLFLGRITGISGIIGGIVMPEKGQVSWRVIFVLSLVTGGAIYPFLCGKDLSVTLDYSWPVYLVAGLLVGVGTRMGSGCTSGHGICGLARLSNRSIVATVTFIATAALTHTVFSLITA
ncbi:MAG: YeeE/YedE thiosulfate transporter family protein [Gammaproteobacteria bacterium]|nr:YeeE/YedE thiosulfate transporter family protein [Gammaproteobacteria bacterium]